jgi:hypothetical protein
VTQDVHRIENLEQLREVLGEPSDLVRQKVFDGLDDVARGFIAASPLVLLSTSNAAGDMDVSPKGDEPGFVAVENDRTLLVPDRTGNKLAFGHENLLENPRIGMIFLVPGARETLRVNGRAELTRDPAVLAALPAKGKPALLATRVFIDEAFMHCGKAMIRSALWKPDTWQKDFKPNLGLQFARMLGAGDDAAPAIEEQLEKDYVENI